MPHKPGQGQNGPNLCHKARDLDWSTLRRLRLTWDPSGLLLPAAPGVITFITAAVLLAMLSGASFTDARTDVRLCRSTKGTRQMNTGAMGEHLQGA